MAEPSEPDAVTAIRARLAVATPGPLQIESHSHPQAGCRCLSCEVVTGCRLDHPSWVCCDETPEMQQEVQHAKAAGRQQEDCPYAPIPYPDAKFLAHAQEDMAYLLAERDRLRAALGKVLDEFWRATDSDNGLELHYFDGSLSQEEMDAARAVLAGGGTDG